LQAAAQNMRPESSNVDAKKHMMPHSQIWHHVPMSIFDFFKTNHANSEISSSETDTVRKIIKTLDRMEPDRAKYLAGFAYLLGRAARADLNISLEETQTMERILMDSGGLSEELAIIVIQMAKTQNMLFGGTENYLVSREFRAISTHPERLALLDCLYAVAASERLISTIEDNEISQIADELRIEHRDFISIRSKYRDSLAVFQKDSMP
jgi:uncharacterized tellurite resistance protein B-like protein